MIILHDAVSTLQIHAAAFSCFVDAHHLPTVEKIVRKYGLDAAPLHTLAQCANSLAAVASIQNENTTMRGVDYPAAIIYFENLMKHLNAGGTISMAEAALLDSCFEEWREKIEDMISAQKCLGLLR